MLPALNLDEDFADELRINVTVVMAPKSSRVLRAEFETPQPNRLIADSNTTLGHKILDVAATQIEAMIQSDDMLNYFRRESVAFVQR
jgi:inactivated superfamily I helicase